MARTRSLLAVLLLLLLLPACSGKAPDYVYQAFPGATAQQVKGEGVEEVWAAKDKDGHTIGYFALAAAQGYHDLVRVAVAWTPGQGITHVQVVDQDESPDYGGEHLHSLWFTDQFLGNPLLQDYSLVKMQRKAANDVVIITGATISSHAVTQAINSCLQVFRTLDEEESQ